MKKYLLFIIGLFAWQGIVWADDSGAILGKAAQLYKNKQYSQAFELYNKALAGNPDSALINFNAGDAQYKMNQFDKAAGLFEKALTAPDKKTESWANYNLATADYKLAESEEKENLPEAGKHLESAAGYYRRAIELDPNDQDAKINYELTIKKLRELKQQPQSKQEQQDKSGQNKNKEQSPPQSQPAKENQDGSKEAPPAAGGKDKIEPMSEQEARMLLRSSSQDERPYGKLNDKHQSQEEEVTKDW